MQSSSSKFLKLSFLHLRARGFKLFSKLDSYRKLARLSHSYSQCGIIFKNIIPQRPIYYKCKQCQQLSSISLLYPSGARPFCINKDGNRRDISDGNRYHEEVDEEQDKMEYDEYVRDICAIPGVGHQVLVIQPDIKAGPRGYRMTRKELKLEETCTLVESLSNWNVVEKMFVRTDMDSKNKFFGKGNFERLIPMVRENKRISAVVIGIDRLRGLQIRTLQTAWGVPVFDRYTIVLQVFRDHAQSPEALLQVALAEIPYVRSRLFMIASGTDPANSHLAGGEGDMHIDKRKLLLQRRESRLKKELELLHSKRQSVRDRRTKDNVPTVAIVGYTNCGKTTLIKTLTQDKSLQPENRLFATLDVTPHEGRLSSMLKVTYIDTVGFISDMPTTLLEAFKITLEDAVMADVVVHLRDASHPDLRLQVASVHQTLAGMLGPEKMGAVIDVYNKVDLLDAESLQSLDPSILQMSALTGLGLAELASQVQEGLMTTAGLLKKRFRIPNTAGPMMEWLTKEAAIQSADPDPQDSQFLILNVIISKSAYGKFQGRFARKNPPSSPTKLLSKDNR